MTPDQEQLLRDTLAVAFPDAGEERIRAVVEEFAERAGLNRLDEDIDVTEAERARLALFLWESLGEGDPEGLEADPPGALPGPGSGSTQVQAGAGA